MYDGRITGVIDAAGADIVSVSETRMEGDPCTADVCAPRGPSVALKLAEALGLNGTPSYVIGNDVVVGAVGLAKLGEKIQAARQQ